MIRRGRDNGRRRPVVIGVTGNIACGKSTVMRILGELGAELIDADRVYHELIEPGRPLWQALLDRFGQRILGSQGQIDRRALGAIVFGDPAALAELDALTHPAIIDAIRQRLDHSTSPVVAVDAVKLVESGMAALCDQVWLVTCDPEQQLTRLMTRGGLTREDARRRIQAQPPLAPQLARANVIIDNSGDIEATRRQVLAAWQRLPLQGEPEPAAQGE